MKKSTRKTSRTFWRTLKKIENIERTLTSIMVGSVDIVIQLCKGDWGLGGRRSKWQVKLIQWNLQIKDTLGTI